MQEHFIIKLLGIKDSHIELWDSGEDEQGFWFELHTKLKSHRCPRCRAYTKRMHNYRTQKIQAECVNGKPVILYVKKRRYRCENCSKTFYERLSFVNRYQRHTSMLEQEAVTLCAEMSFTLAARLTGLSVSRLIRFFDRRKIEAKKVLPRAIAIDEFKGDAGGERYQTVIVDVEKKEIIDVLPNRRASTIENYFKDCDTSQVEMVVIDLSQAFKGAIRRQLGNPLIIADRFHYMRQAYWAFDKVRRNVQHELLKNHRIRMKRNKELLWKSPTKLDEKGKERVKELLVYDSRLKEAYELKNELDHWFKSSTKETAKEGLEAWFQRIEGSGNESFMKVVKTFTCWKQEILQSFMYTYNNGYIEGVNNTTKVIKRMSYGIKSFERLRKKILWRQIVRSVLD